MITLTVEHKDKVEVKEVRNLEMLKRYIKEAFLVMESTEEFHVYISIKDFGRLELT